MVTHDSTSDLPLYIRISNLFLFYFYFFYRKSAIIEVLPPPAADPIVGKYRLLKTENFDEFMKKLGVGLVKRKLANSVSPMNVIIVNDDGRFLRIIYNYITGVSMCKISVKLISGT